VRLGYPPHFVTLGEQDALAEGGYVVLVGARSASGSSSEEVPLNWSKWVRQTHRWLSIAFTVTVIANFVAMSQGEPPAWVTYSPLLPLALLLFTGLYLFVLPYATTWRSGRRTD
jgi:cellulose synthase/poly-beta-1,6-N-acetylglucosamine synthase-like glycosyltransferase